MTSSEEFHEQNKNMNDINKTEDFNPFNKKSFAVNHCHTYTATVDSQTEAWAFIMQVTNKNAGHVQTHICPVFNTFTRQETGQYEVTVSKTWEEPEGSNNLNSF